MKKTWGTTTRRSWVTALALAVVAIPIGVVAPTPADAEPLPDSCKAHPTQVVNPGCVPAIHGQVDDAVASIMAEPVTYPDLVPDVTETFVFRDVIGFDPETNEFVWGPPQIAFDTWSQNLGPVALDLMSDDPTNLTNPPVSQCVSWNPDHIRRERRQVGGFELHPTHGHFHFNDFARYELRRLLADGTPDYSAAGLIDTSEKVSFCLIDSTRVRDDAVPVPTYVGCGSTREGISAGWADIYTSDLDGQQLSLEGLTDGRYALVVSMDHADHVYESDNGNNVVEVTLELSNGVNDVAVVDRRWP